MNADNLLFLESLFMPQYRNKLPTFIEMMVLGNQAGLCVIEAHVLDLKNNEKMDISPDCEALEKMVKKLQKALRNRVKAFKMVEESGGTIDDFVELYDPEYDQVEDDYEIVE